MLKAYCAGGAFPRRWLLFFERIASVTSGGGTGATNFICKRDEIDYQSTGEPDILKR
ncbi:MAG: hypothetical protein KAU52_04605 [Methanosarcinales archaeon]|nr:hypothetical protein [Methanosarcinales archaeon]MCK4811344.1 hypothetical protein [Methanosarcinales archaeon]